MAETITADLIIHDVVTKHPETVKVFHGHGLPCTACAVGSRESIAGGARTHRFTPEKQALLLKDLNAVINGEPVSVAPKKAPVGRGVPLTMAPAGKDGQIKQVIAVMSGKGGVGKSLVVGLLAVSLRRQGLRVGILDGDITGPSMARMFGTRGQPSKSANGGIEPLTSMGGIRLMSMNMFLENESDPVVWRGPMVSSAIKQFYSDVDWGELDYLFVDLPPGTSDAPMTVLQSLPVDGIIIVSSPQLLATMVVKKCINMVRQLKGVIVGVVENMAYFETPDGQRPEIPQPIQQPRSPDQAPRRTPIQAFKNFVRRWGATKWTLAFNTALTINTLATGYALSTGNYKAAIAGGILDGIWFVGSFLTAKTRDTDVQQGDKTIVQLQRTIQNLQGPDGQRYEIFGPSNGPELVDMTGAPLLAQLPIDPILTSLCDAGRIEEYHGAAFEELAANFINTLKIKR